MKTSESISKIAPALLAAQRAITFASKDATNPAFKSRYADLPSVIDAVKPALNAAGITFLQTFSPSEHGSLALTTRLLHESGEWIEDTATMPMLKVDPQGYGSAATYARRYSLAAITGLYQDDDDGNAATKPAAKVAAKPVVPGIDISDTLMAMRESDDAEAMRSIARAAYAKCNAVQKAEITAAVNKLERELGETA
jgi:hypothetical protein